MRTRMPHAYGESDLRVAMIVDLDVGGVAAKRSAAIRADDKRRMQCAASLSDCDCVGLRRDAETSSSIICEGWQTTGALLERFDQMTIFDIVSEGLKLDFVRHQI